ncbi:CheR family methyltransferase [Maridesulfovibrio sp.]|uniref:CheR family methyltransferase n=1 Tax=Maridesulfovibrio sp. TaxID=2795000 RepID=UPI002A186D36|nr:CheR family methyltransferase [Maridesulfovibrio sp.]
MCDILDDGHIRKLAEMVRGRYGLDFGPDRWRDLRQAVQNFHTDCDRFSSAEECLEYILSTGVSSRDLEMFINRLTIGETYFFRDPQALDVLEREVLRGMNGRGSGMGGAVRIWSMACATGEEPYTMAMICRRSNIRSEIIGTDIDSMALAKAAEGCYRKWSFRTGSMAFRDMYFRSTGPNGFLLDKSIRGMVALSRFNLIGDEVPSSFMNMDIVLCRNVLMYFSNSGVDKVLGKIWSSLAPGGLLVVTPSESALVSSRGRFEPVLHDQVTFFRKNEGYVPESLYPAFSVQEGSDSEAPYAEVCSYESGAGFCLGESDFEDPAGNFMHEESSGYFESRSENDSEVSPAECNDCLAEAARLQQNGEEEKALALLRNEIERGGRASEASVYFAMAGILADTGRLEEAAKCCEHAIDIDQIVSEFHFLMGQIRELQGRTEQALAELRNAVFLDPAFIMAHVLMGNIFVEQNDYPSAVRHFRIALQELEVLDAVEIVPYSDGTTAAGLISMVGVVQRSLA